MNDVGKLLAGQSASTVDAASTTSAMAISSGSRVVAALPDIACTLMSMADICA
jgi:hypothetical protein